MKFGQVLKGLRSRHNLTQGELAKLLNVSKSTVSMYELGERMPSYEMLEAIASAFNVDIDTLFGKEKPTAEPLVLSVDEQELIALYRANPDMQTVVKKLLRK